MYSGFGETNFCTTSSRVIELLEFKHNRRNCISLSQHSVVDVRAMLADMYKFSAGIAQTPVVRFAVDFMWMYCGLVVGQFIAPTPQ